ncbi:MAG: hypothetical protein JXX29_09110 [Deltaproteobacteria bacterium]|nr:hypothetical protein [Deltaproteobacteria bacterium]MBN2671821.1 hypothetical protein [Deltaproteobacteria bacterium]
MKSTTQKPFLPSSARVAFAAQSGLFVHSHLFVFGCILAGVSGIGLIFGPGWVASFVTAFSETLIAPSLAGCLREHLSHLLGVSLAMVAVPLTVGFGAILAVRRQKRAGRSAVPLPRQIPTTKDGLLLALLGTAVLVPVSIVLARNAGFTFSEIEYAPAAAAIRLVTTLFRIALAAGLTALFLGLLQLSLYKIRLFQHLSLTSAEQEKEQRLHGRSDTRQQFYTSTGGR